VQVLLLLSRVLVAATANSNHVAAIATFRASNRAETSNKLSPSSVANAANAGNVANNRGRRYAASGAASGEISSGPTERKC
jgi:hypothetical protein